MRSFIARTLLVSIIGLGAIACGDDAGSSQSDEEAFCAAGEQLRADVADLGEVEVVAEGSDAVQASFDMIRADADALVASGQDLATADVNAVEQAVDALGAALGSLDGELTAENSTAVVNAVSEVGTAVQGLGSTLAETCG